MSKTVRTRKAKTPTAVATPIACEPALVPNVEEIKRTAPSAKTAAVEPKQPALTISPTPPGSPPVYFIAAVGLLVMIAVFPPAFFVLSLLTFPLLILLVCLGAWKMIDRLLRF
jgi:hypothetical protein